MRKSKEGRLWGWWWDSSEGLVPPALQWALLAQPCGRCWEPACSHPWRCQSSCPPPSPVLCLQMFELLGSSAHAVSNAAGEKQIFFFSNQSCTTWEVKLKTGLLSISSSMSTVRLPQRLQEQPPSSAHSATYWILHIQDNFPTHTASTLPNTSTATAANTAWLDRAPGRLQQYRLIQALHILFWRAVLAQKDLTLRQVRMYFLQELSTALALHLPALAAHLWRSILNHGIRSWKEKLQRKCVSPNRLTCSTLFYPENYKTTAEALPDFSKPFVRIMAVQGKGGKGTKSLLSPETTHYTNLCT